MYHLGDVVQMKKPHACGENKWEILRMGADIRIKCLGCGHLIMMPQIPLVPIHHRLSVLLRR